MEIITMIGSFMLEMFGGTGQIFILDTPGTHTFTVMSIFLCIGHILDRMFPPTLPIEDQPQK